MDNAIEELLRFDSPVQFAGRVSETPVEIAGIRVEPGTNVMLALGCANHDERRFARPDELDVRRKDPKPLSFGGGAHYCVGAALARLETRIAFRNILERATRIELVSERAAWRAHVGFRGLEALPIALRA
jgi:cytochrome P450